MAHELQTWQEFYKQHWDSKMLFGELQPQWRCQFLPVAKNSQEIKLESLVPTKETAVYSASLSCGAEAVTQY